MLIFALAFVQLVSAQHEGSRPSVLVAFRNGKLHLPCKPIPDRMDADFKLTLRKDNHQEPVCTVSWTKNKTEIDPGQGGTHCDVQRSTKSVSFILTKLDRNHTDYYICHVEIFYPPPYRNTNLSTTYVYVHDKELLRCECGPFLPFWPLVGIAVALLLCPVLLIALCLRMRLTKSAPASHEPGSEYMAMAAVNAARKSHFKENTRFEKVTRSSSGQ
ncbi:inducible T-cell costimulator [Lissotriton helveticus]